MRHAPTLGNEMGDLTSGQNEQKQNEQQQEPVVAVSARMAKLIAKTEADRIKWGPIGAARLAKIEAQREAQERKVAGRITAARVARIAKQKERDAKRDAERKAAAKAAKAAKAAAKAAKAEKDAKKKGGKVDRGTRRAFDLINRMCAGQDATGVAMSSIVPRSVREFVYHMIRHRLYHCIQSGDNRYAGMEASAFARYAALPQNYLLHKSGQYIRGKDVDDRLPITCSVERALDLLIPLHAGHTDPLDVHMVAVSAVNGVKVLERKRTAPAPDDAVLAVTDALALVPDVLLLRHTVNTLRKASVTVLRKLTMFFDAHAQFGLTSMECGSIGGVRVRLVYKEPQPATLFTWRDLEAYHKARVAGKSASEAVADLRAKAPRDKRATLELFGVSGKKATTATSRAAAYTAMFAGHEVAEEAMFRLLGIQRLTYDADGYEIIDDDAYDTYEGDA